MGDPRIFDLVTVGGGVRSVGSSGADDAAGNFSATAAAVISFNGPSLILGTSVYMNHDATEGSVGLDAGFGGPIWLGVFADIRARLAYNFREEDLDPGLLGRLGALVPIDNLGVMFYAEGGVLDLTNPLGSMTLTAGIAGSFTFLSGN